MQPNRINTKKTNDMKSNRITSAGHSSNTVVVGSFVKFYDCYRADKDRNHSGEEKYWSVGKVINRRITERTYYPFSDMWLGGDDVVDIELPDGRISKGHFTHGVTVV